MGGNNRNICDARDDQHGRFDFDINGGCLVGSKRYCRFRNGRWCVYMANQIEDNVPYGFADLSILCTLGDDWQYANVRNNIYNVSHCRGS